MDRTSRLGTTRPTVGRSSTAGATGATGPAGVRTARVAAVPRATSVSAAIALAVALTGCGAASDAGGGQRFLSIGTGGTGGIYYPVGGALANRLTERDSMRRFTAEVSGGSVENVNRVLNGDIGLGFAVATTVYRSYHGEGGPERADALRVVAPLYPNVTHVLVAGGSGVRSIADFRGMRVSVGAPGSGTEQVSRALLAAHDLDYDDIDEQYLSFAESAAALRDGAIEAAIFSVGYPASAVLEATTSGDVRLIGVDTAIVRAMTQEYGYYSPAEIPAGSYPGVTDSLSTIGEMNWVVADSSLAGDVVGEVLSVLRDDREALVRVHGIMRQNDLGALDRAPIPLHPAAERWWADHSGDDSRSDA